MNRFIRLLISTGIILSSLTFVVAQEKAKVTEKKADEKSKVIKAPYKSDEPEATTKPDEKQRFAPKKKVSKGGTKSVPTKDDSFWKRLFGRKKKADLPKEPKEPN